MSFSILDDYLDFHFSIICTISNQCECE